MERTLIATAAYYLSLVHHWPWRHRAMSCRDSVYNYIQYLIWGGGGEEDRVNSDTNTKPSSFSSAISRNAAYILISSVFPSSTLSTLPEVTFSSSRFGLQSWDWSASHPKKALPAGRSVAQSMSLDSRRGPPSSDIVFTRLCGPVGRVMDVMGSKDATHFIWRAQSLVIPSICDQNRKVKDWLPIHYLFLTP